jgi:hypothetical protein
VTKFHAGSQNIYHEEKQVLEDFCNSGRMSCKKSPRAFLPQNITMLFKKAVEITKRKLSTCTSVMTFMSGSMNPQEQVQEADLFLNFANLLYI